MDLIADRIPDMKCGACGGSIDTSKVKPLSRVRCPQCDAEATVPAGFGDLFLIKMLGSGAAGIVCLGLNDKLHRQVAVKVLKKSDDKDDADHVKELLREARLLARLNHPNVVQVYAIGEHEGQPYIEMELVTGGQLDRKILEGEPIDEVTALGIAIGVAEGLQAALGVGLIHRDVKPGNILLDPRGTPKLLDFGTAGAGGETNGTVGTPYYVAPEVIRKQPVDFHADIYSLGASLFHMIAVRPPFEGSNSREVIKARLQQRAPQLSEVVSSVHPATDHVVARMLEPDPADRHTDYDELIAELRQAQAAAQDAAEQQAAIGAPPVGAADANELANALASVAGEEPAPTSPSTTPATVATPTSGAQRFAPKPKGNRKLVWIIGGIIAAIIIGLVVLAFILSQDGDEKDKASDAQDDTNKANTIASATGEERTPSPTDNTPTPADDSPAQKADSDDKAHPPTPTPTPPDTNQQTTKPDTTTPATPDNNNVTATDATQPKPTPRVDTPPKPTPQPKPAPAVAPPYEAFVNLGATEPVDVDGQTWQPAPVYGAPTQGKRFGHVGGRSFRTDKRTDPLHATYLFQVEAIRFDLPNGKYDVTLTFAEPADLGPGDRVFTVRAEGDDLGKPVDAAGESVNGVTTRQATVTVEDGRLDILFISDNKTQFVSSVKVVNAK